jgi:hypothetical protein
MITYEQALEIVTECLSAVGITIKSDEDLIQKALKKLHDLDPVASDRLYQCIYSRVTALAGVCRLTPDRISDPDYDHVRTLATLVQGSSQQI